jgi:hypothetical protein
MFSYFLNWIKNDEISFLSSSLIVQYNNYFLFYLFFSSQTHGHNLKKIALVTSSSIQAYLVPKAGSSRKY